MPDCQKLFRTVLLFVVVLGTSYQINAQELTHVLGEILVVPEERLVNRTLESSLSTFENFRTQAMVQDMKTAPIQVFKVTFDHNTTHETRFLDKIRSMDGVKMAQFNHLIEYRVIPDDPQFPQQWQYLNDGINGEVADADIDMDLAWNITTGGLTMNGDTIVACVIDGGMDPTHGDFGDNLWKNWAEIPDNGIDDDNNGYVDDFHGWSAYEANDDVFKGGSHGTPVAGIIGAKGNNGVGVSGVNWDVKIMIIRGGGNEADAIAAYTYPYLMRKKYNETNGEEGAFVVTTNASWGTDLLHWEDAPIWCSFYDSLGTVGILNCGATANRNYNIDEQGDMPTSCPSDYLISVTNMTSDDEKVTSAGYGIETIDLGAFGAGTWTTAINNNYGGFGGTSGATPHVTGTVALAYATSCEILADLSKTDPGQAALLVKDFILSGTKPNESLLGKTVTGGKLNVFNTLNKLIDYCECPFPVSVEVEEVGIDQASISWDFSTDTVDFDMVYRKVGAEDWDTLKNVVSPVLLSDLQNCMIYEFKLKTRCPDGSGSFSFVNSFQTEGCCIVPENHTLLEDGNLLFIALDDIIATDSYTLEYQSFGQLEWTSISLDTNVFVLPHPGDCGAYFYRFKSDCGGEDSGFSEIFVTDFQCEVCSVDQLCSIEGDNFYEFIDSLEIDGFINVSGRNPDGFGNYTFASSVTFENGRTYPFKLIPGFNDNSFDEYIAVFIDLNLDGQLTEEERVFNDILFEGEIIDDFLEIPADISTGFAKMRVILSYQNIEDPCEEITYGEAEDYCVYLDQTKSLCILDTLVADTISIGMYEASIAWNQPEAVIDFEYRIRKQGDAGWSSYITMESEVNLESLDSCSTYDFQVRSNCQDGQGEFSDTLTFTTDCLIGTTQTKPATVGMDVFPNPFSDQLVVQLPEGMNKKPAEIQLIDAQGKKRLIVKGQIIDDGGQIKLNLNELSFDANGIFYLEVLVGQELMIQKVARLAN